jgi:hypothetical protein
MTKTENFQFNQWDAADPIRRQDFNRDNAILDAALGAQGDKLEEIAGAVAGLGNCRIVTGSYKGNGTYGSDNPNTLSFPGKPLVVIVNPRSSDAYSVGLFAVTGSPELLTYPHYPASWCKMTWLDRGLTWYSSEAEYQLNRNGATYHYAVLLQAGT